MKSLLPAILIVFTVSSCDSAVIDKNEGKKAPDENGEIIIQTNGGTVGLTNLIHVDFPAGALMHPATVSIFKRSDADLPGNSALTKDLFRIDTALDYYIVIEMDQALSPEGYAAVTVDIPDDYLTNLKENYGIDIFALIYADGGEETLDSLTLLDSTIDYRNKKLSVSLPSYAFSDKRRNDGKYEAILTAASTPGKITNNTDASFKDTCNHTSSLKLLSPPVKREIISSDFGERINPETGKKRFHFGIDFAVPVGTDVFAAADGTIEMTGNDPSGYGYFIIVRHSDGSAALYAHLSVNNIYSKGYGWYGFRPVIGKSGGAAGAEGSGNSRGPHLHFEYVPSGNIVQSKQRICPWPLISYIYPSVKGGWFYNSTIALYINGSIVINNTVFDEISLRPYFMEGDSNFAEITFIMNAVNPNPDGTQFSAGCRLQFLNCKSTPYYLYNGTAHTVTTPYEGPPQLSWSSYPFGTNSGILADWTTYPVIIEY